MLYCQLICVGRCPLRHKALLNDKSELWRNFRDLYFSLWCDYAAWLLCLIRFRLYITLISLIFQLNTHTKLNILYCLLNISYMFQRSLRHPQGELLSLLKTIYLLWGRYNGWIAERLSFIKISRWFWELIRVLPEEGAVIAETCSRYLVNNTNIQLYMCI
jgi:hypothetical protein